MNKKIIAFTAGVVIFTCLVFVPLNMTVTTRQGVNFTVREIQMPLYLKLLDFWDRHYNYKNLVYRVTERAGNEEEKIMRIFEWTNKNIRKNPKELPIIDDHVWTIIVRGYGVDDQFQDVFTTLCNYSGIKAFFNILISQDGKSRITLSFVRLKRGWSVFDAYHGVYFTNRQGEFATIDELMAEKWLAIRISNDEIPQYSVYFGSLSSFDEKVFAHSRASVQSPLRRFILWFQKNK